LAADHLVVAAPDGSPAGEDEIVEVGVAGRRVPHAADRLAGAGTDAEAAAVARPLEPRDGVGVLRDRHHRTAERGERRRAALAFLHACGHGHDRGNQRDETETAHSALIDAARRGRFAYRTAASPSSAFTSA